MGYLHVEVNITQTSKKPGNVCGDVAASSRTPEYTLILLADGIGSGVKANIYANMVISRIQRLIENGFSLRHAFNALVTTMHESRGTELPYSVFTIVQVLNNGEATVLSYEMPEAIFVGQYNASVLKRKNLMIKREIKGESNLFLEAGESLILYSDGISNAGVGGNTKLGWNSDEVCCFVNDRIVAGEARFNLGKRVHQQAKDLWGTPCGDDCTVINLVCRKGKIANILTGPPANRSDDKKVIKEFLDLPGIKIVSGATTAKLVAKYLNCQVQINQADSSLIAPPGYSIEGIDLVTEGAVTLNQLYNIFDSDPTFFEQQSSVTRLYDALIDADRVNFILGSGKNIGHSDIAFKQQGILPRQTIVKLLAEKLVADNRLVQVKVV